MDAINNYWRHAKRNPHVKIRFRYLTTAAIGIERKRLTNDAGPALDQWNRARLEDSARSRDFARTLADALAARASVDKIGRASCRERVCPYVLLVVGAVLLKKK